MAAWPRIEPTAARSQVQRPNRYATESPYIDGTSEQDLVDDVKEGMGSFDLSAEDAVQKQKE